MEAWVIVLLVLAGIVLVVAFILGYRYWKRQPNETQRQNKIDRSVRLFYAHNAETEDITNWNN